jgi:hypothetical protein
MNFILPVSRQQKQSSGKVKLMQSSGSYLNKKQSCRQ